MDNMVLVPGEKMVNTISASKSQVYKQNLEFWQRAWNMVKVPYTQLPDLNYIPRIPAELEAKKDSRILDLGCGSGWLSVFLARNGFKMVGVDVAEHAVELARTWAGDESLDIEFIVQDISELDFPGNHFAAVVANSIFEHLTLDLACQTVEKLTPMVEADGLFIGCFDKVGTGPGEYYKLEDGTQVYTDKGRKDMILRCFSDQEIRDLFGSSWDIQVLEPVSDLTRMLIARKRA